MLKLKILYQDAQVVVVNKPSGFYVHPPEDMNFRISKNVNTLALLRDQLGQYVYPVHRLDRSTSGVLLFALDPVTARSLSEQFIHRQVDKVYYAYVRGWTQESGTIDTPIEGQEALTCYQRIARIETDYSVGQHATSRYSLLRVKPETGRLHQIRRHLRRISHPIIGDTVYGDGRHNRAVWEQIGKRMLFLKAHQLSFVHPITRRKISVSALWKGEWHLLFNHLGICPWDVVGRSEDEFRNI